MYGRIVKSERILTKLRVLDYEYICDRIAKFHKKILFSTRVINNQILTTKYFSYFCPIILHHLFLLSRLLKSHLRILLDAFCTYSCCILVVVIMSHRSDVSLSIR